MPYLVRASGDRQMPRNRTLIAMNVPGPCFFRFPTTGRYAQGPRINLPPASRPRSPAPSDVSSVTTASSMPDVDWESSQGGDWECADESPQVAGRWVCYHECLNNSKLWVWSALGSDSD